MNKKPLPPTLKTTGLKALLFLRHHTVIICVVLFGGLYAYLLVQINMLDSRQPDSTSLDPAVASSRPKIDKAAAQKMTELEDQNVEVKAIFEQARNNPFQE